MKSLRLIEAGFDNRNVRYKVIDGKIIIVAPLTFESTSVYHRATVREQFIHTKSPREQSKLINTDLRKLDV